MGRRDGSFNELTIAPSFKDLLQAVIEERRSSIKNTDFYKYVEKGIRAKCEESARELREEITLHDLSKHLCSNSFSLGMTYTSNYLINESGY